MKRKSDFILQNIAGEKLLVPIGSQVMDMNGLVTLNETAACVWELLAEERTLDDLTAAVAEEFDVDSQRARADVQTFIDEITRMELLVQ
ncbi:MAG: PqqD family protein [Candidatus Electrothrix scaldis]|nr:MAG: PqqD family protein [Candidatus Electrothrix sp. GW3-3]